jgi:hypothetical protein
MIVVHESDHSSGARTPTLWACSASVPPPARPFARSPPAAIAGDLLNTFTPTEHPPATMVPQDRNGELPMTRIREEITVACPLMDAFEHARAHFYNLNGLAPSRAQVTLRAPVGEVTLDRDVFVSLQTQPGNAARRGFAISWEPKGGGPYPRFEGSLELRVADAASCIMELSGSYDPPLSVAGKAFDAAVGRRIAAASVEAFLTTLRDAIESARRATLLASHDFLPSHA